MNPHHTLTEPSLQTHPRKGREGKGNRKGELRDEVPIHLQTVPGRPGRMDGRSAARHDAIGICQRCHRPIEHGQPYMARIPVLVGSWYGFDHKYCPPELVGAP